MSQIKVFKRRTKTITYEMREDISNDIFSFQIRTGQHHTAPLIAEWDVEFNTDGKDGKLLLSLSETITAAITQKIGYMDGKRLIGGSDGEPVPLIPDKLTVVFIDPVTL